MPVTSSSLRINLVGLNFSPEPTGIGPYTSHLARGLSERGHDVTVTTGYPHYPQWRLSDEPFDDEADQPTITVRRKAHHIPSRLSLPARARMEIEFGLRAAFTERSRPDVILCVSPALFSTAIVFAREFVRCRRPALAVLVQDFYGLGMSETGIGGQSAAFLVRQIERSVLRSADSVAVIHDRFARHVVEDLGVKSDRVRVFRNWAKEAAPEPSDRTEAIRRLGWQDFEDSTIVLHAGNMGVKQGLENVVEAARLADHTNAPVMFVLLGDGNQRASIEAKADVVKRITFIDPLPQDLFLLALSAADILLVNEGPSVTEMALPSKLTTYFTTGKPVVAAVRADGVTGQEVLSGGGIVVPPGDQRALLDAVLTLRSNPSRASEYSQTAREFARAHLDADVTIDRISEWLIDLRRR